MGGLLLNSRSNHTAHLATDRFIEKIEHFATKSDKSMSNYAVLDCPSSNSFEISGACTSFITLKMHDLMTNHEMPNRHIRLCIGLFLQLGPFWIRRQRLHVL